MTEQVEVKMTGNETIDRLAVKPAPYFKPFIPIGGVMAGVGVAVKIVAALFPPAIPLAVVSLMPELISIGLTLLGTASLTKDPNPPNGIQKPSLLYKLINAFRN
jgi:hypothetical protein